MKVLIFIGILTVSSVVLSGDIGLLPDVIVEPENIDINTPIQVAFDSSQGPCYATTPFTNGEPFFINVDEKNNISFVIPATIFTPCPLIEGGYRFSEIGTLPAGEYIIQYNFVTSRDNYPPNPLSYVPFADPVAFVVRGVRPELVSSLSVLSSFILLLVFISIGLIRIKSS